MKSKKIVKRIEDARSRERERVLYDFDSKKFVINVSTTFNDNKVSIAKADILALIAHVNDKHVFYAYVNKSIKLLRQLECDAQARKEQLCKNTQYDSRKKLIAICQHIALSVLKQKSKSKSKTTKRVSKKISSK